jgi:ABC-type spermidine/putrescine transport system permease subunit II
VSTNKRYNSLKEKQPWEKVDNMHTYSINDVSYLLHDDHPHVRWVAQAELERRQHRRTWAGIYIAIFTAFVTTVLGLINTLITYYYK